MKAFISQPMNGKTDEQIRAERESIKKWLEKCHYEVIDTLFDFGDKSPIYYLGKSIEVMAEADLVVFIDGWENARGCLIEYEVAKSYSKNILILGKTND